MSQETPIFDLNEAVDYIVQHAMESVKDEMLRMLMTHQTNVAEMLMKMQLQIDELQSRIQ